MNSPRDLYLAACKEIAESFSSLGFKFARSGPHTQRKHGEFTYRISFQTSPRNIAGHYVALSIHANVLSKRLAEWRTSQASALGSGDYVAGGQIGNLVRPHGWRDWNLAVSNRSPVIADAISAVLSIALPYFDRFEDIPSLCTLLRREELPAMEIAHIVEFLLCFADRSAADAAMSGFFRSRPDLLADYYTHLQEFRERGLPQVRRTGFAYELAFATVAYGLAPPNVS
jgi:hypothetical protein